MFRRGPRTPSTTSRRPTSRYSNSHYPSSPSSTPSKRPSTSARGLFANSSWHCDCTPRLPAEHFRVKKEGKNHGRWFYTCQNSEGKRCGFFLWDEDAKLREEKAVLAGKTTEPGREGEEIAQSEDGKRFEAWEAQMRGTQRGKGEGEANPAWVKGREAGEKRKREEVVELDGSETDDDLDDLMSWPPTARGELETPSKRLRTEEVTPPMTKRKLPWMKYDEDEGTLIREGETGLPTPSLTKLADGQDPSTSPTTGRFRDAMRSPPIEAAGSTATQSLSTEVFDLLKEHGVSLGDKAQGDMRAVLNKHEMKLQGVVKGRDLVRAALKGKEARIAELQGRIAGIEAEREVLRAALSRLKGPDA
ncbi:Hypothetical protein D9617_15g043580 [Elsinoe fawcettii]|nr:Hypothetical protein D9617_15g043580 [Elsinoe fawcettii]